MSTSQRIGLSLLVCLAQACGGTHSDAGPTAGSGPGSGGGGGADTQEQAGGGGSPSAAGSGTVGPQTTSDKLDVLFVIDNSIAMAEKQRVLASSVPKFVARLINPLCVDSDGVAVSAQPATPGADCPSGSREFEPLTDIHFGAISTSIGSHGGDVCNSTSLMQQDDQAQLLPSKRDGLTSYKNSGFLAYDASGAAGDTDASAIASNLSAIIAASGDQGCGYEAPLEAMYRFLVDPEPPASVQVVNQVSTVTSTNDLLLQQRKAFLRPDSSLAIVILSDENDCSMMDSGMAWLPSSIYAPGTTTSQLRMPRATSVCETNPNDPCCRSCSTNEATPPSGCMPLSADSVCSVIPTGGTYAAYDPLNDSLNLRCFAQQRRFGFDVMHPIERYSDALSSPKIKNRAGDSVDNPLFSARDGKGPRSASQVSVSVIVGVPWQDLATSASLDGGPLVYLDSAALESNGRWPVLVGDPEKNVLPTDPLMIESIAPRSGKNPVTNFAIAPANSTSPQQNPINGHEKNNADQADLQFACIWNLAKPVACEAGDYQCDCSSDRSGSVDTVIAANSPVCQPSSGGPAGTTQYYGRAYPGTRELSFVKQLGARGLAASICPKSETETSPDFGYVPALDALLERIAKTVK